MIMDRANGLCRETGGYQRTVHVAQFVGESPIVDQTRWKNGNLVVEVGPVKKCAHIAPIPGEKHAYFSVL